MQLSPKHADSLRGREETQRRRGGEGRREGSRRGVEMQGRGMKKPKMKEDGGGGWRRRKGKKGERRAVEYGETERRIRGRRIKNNCRLRFCYKASVAKY